MNTTIYFDMDGTIANLYGVKNWLYRLTNLDETPYKEAYPLLKLNQLAFYLNKIQKQGYKIGIISWLAKNPNKEYAEKVIYQKKMWLKKHLKSVTFDEIHIVPYGTDKKKFAHNVQDILFDDEEHNRISWIGENAFAETQIINILKKIYKRG